MDKIGPLGQESSTYKISYEREREVNGRVINLSAVESTCALCHADGRRALLASLLPFCGGVGGGGGTRTRSLIGSWSPHGARNKSRSQEREVLVSPLLFLSGGKHFIENKLENNGILEVYGVPDVRCGFIPAKNGSYKRDIVDGPGIKILWSWVN